MAQIIEEILTCMPSSNNIQKVQTQHRLTIAETWEIKKGNKILEIGCGQGDTTAVLAYLTGENGLVHGIDIASADYGAPLTLGESVTFLQNSALGSRIKIDFETDILTDPHRFPDNYFDYIVLSHSSWYLRSFEELAKMLKILRKWGKQLCFAEWDPSINSVEQYPHFLAVLIQAQYEAFKKNSTANVRTLFTPEDIRKLAKDAGWEVIKEQSIHSPDLQDADWEVHMTLADYQEELAAIEMPEKLRYLIESEIHLLKASIEKIKLSPMSTYTFIAT
ncbi:class I SAM-dependent methyltransferase [Peribacillus sp. FSL H8-0477]|uniref:class I SAM-dependent methyltransferase n=1 Tax=Peribacillus sp. FSL H8-0477 TaxID=2921388 RepID=UPI0030F7ACED